MNCSVLKHEGQSTLKVVRQEPSKHFHHLRTINKCVSILPAVMQTSYLLIQHLDIKIEIIESRFT